MAKLMIMMMSNVTECKQSTNEEGFTNKTKKFLEPHVYRRGRAFCGTRPALCFHDWSLPLCAKLGGE